MMTMITFVPTFLMILLLLTGGGLSIVLASPTETATEPEPAEETTAEETEETPTTEPEEEEKESSLPPCDGSAQDCVTNNGDTCLEGQGGHECECEEDMSDCPNHPSLLEEVAATESQDDIHPCLLDPSDPVCPEPDPETQDCPEGYAQNEDGNCFLLHPEGCPEGYHGHEDDETGRCIPNSTPCDPGYTMNEEESNCEREHFTCDGKPSVVPCEEEEDDDNNDNNDNDNNKKKDKDVIIKRIHDTKVIKQITDSNDDLGIEQTIIAISYDEGKGINCVIEEDNDGQCETFDVPIDKGKQDFLTIIPF